ncbi:neuraminidase-like domain-containing protein [Caballeronia sp. SEWSISQ10-4 2]|uniref:Tc toxin subunit A-related protein n=1 Tax=Caballeronia sp. SEWSISQ10-4 2 TaxID=2937438 RepID=UPI002651EB2D|nr:LamG-like jellyroll fold domain-containing protein [Caballeronia sp. SEWSISQ10-4 2]MDN7182520.1 neuraminidase-like domain-containing protein [Caballeronia sp. SEWSISQ10-4 2]
MNKKKVPAGRALHQWMRLREAASPFASALRARGVLPRSPLPADGAASTDAINYEGLFQEPIYADIPHDASILGSGAYFADLMSVIAGAVTNRFADDPLSLANRRPDLWNLPLTPENATEEISTAVLTTEVLETTLAGRLATHWSGPNASVGFLPPSLPTGHPDVEVCGAAWPTTALDGVTYLLSGGQIAVPVGAAINASVTVRSVYGKPTIAVGGGSIAVGPVSPGQSDPSIFIEGFTFVFADGAVAHALFLFSGGSLTLRNCTFLGTGSQDGWVLSTPAANGGKTVSGTVTFENCTFADSGDGKATAIDLTQAAPLALSIVNSIAWPVGAPVQPGHLARLNPAVAASLDYCDVAGGEAAISLAAGASAEQQVRYGRANFEQKPTRDGAGTPRSLPGRGVDGADVGAGVDVFEAMAWAVYPFSLPFDLALQSGRIALAGLGLSLDDIDRICADVIGNHNQNAYFPLSKLGLSLADYLAISATPKDLPSFFGLASFNDVAVAMSPVPNQASAWEIPSTLFSRIAELTQDALRELVYQDLGPGEIAEGLNIGGSPDAPGWRGFFINGYGAGFNTVALRESYVPVSRSALSFGASNILLAALKTAPTQAFTLSFWMYPEPGWTGGEVVTAGPHFEAQWSYAPGQLTLTLPGLTQPLAVDLSDFMVGPQWLNVTSAWDATTLCVYVNGQLAASVSAALTPSWGQMSLGASGGANPFTGGLCEVALWSFALSPEVIASSFQRPLMSAPTTKGAGPAGLCGYWPVNDGGSTVADWTGNNPPSEVLGTPVWTSIGLPETMVPQYAQQGLSFALVELLTGHGARPGADAGNLDRINRFLRLAGRLNWTPTELDWALATIFQSRPTPPTDLGDIATYADLARIRTLQSALDLPVAETCAFFGPLKTFGHGQLEDQTPLFDQVFNRFSSGMTFSWDMSEPLSVKDDIEAPGPLAYQLAASLNIDLLQLAVVARACADGDQLVVNGPTLTALYRHRVLAGWLQIDFRGLMDLLALTGLGTLAGGCAPADLYAFLAQVAWIDGAGLDATELLYLVDPAAVTSLFRSRIDLEITEALPKIAQALDGELSGSLVRPDSFVSPSVNELGSLAIFNRLQGLGYIDTRGRVTSTLLTELPAVPFHVPSDAYPTITDAVTAAVAALASQPVATVLLAAGTYVQTDLISVTLAKGRLRIQSEYGPTATTIDGGGGGFLEIRQSGDGTLEISGLTIQNCKRTDGVGGGAVYSECPVDLFNCVLQTNQAVNGGAVYVAGSPAIPANFSAGNCIFYNNAATSTTDATGGGSGGAIYLAQAGAKSALNASTLFGNVSDTKLSNGVFVDANSALTVDASILWNTPDNAHPDWTGSLTATNSDTNIGQNPAPGTPPDSSGNVHEEPQLTDPTKGLFDPGPKSPCRIDGMVKMGQSGLPESSGVSASSLYAFAYAQVAVLKRQLARFFKDESLPIETVLDTLGPIENGLVLLAADADASQAADYLRTFYRYLLLSGRFGLDAKLLALVLNDPSLLSLQGGGGLYAPTRGDLRLLANFAALRAQFPGSLDALLGCLQTGQSSDPASGLARLPSLFGWDETVTTMVLESVQIDSCLKATASPSGATPIDNGVVSVQPAWNDDQTLQAFTIESWVKVSAADAMVGGNLFVGDLSGPAARYGVALGFLPSDNHFSFAVQDEKAAEGDAGPAYVLTSITAGDLIVQSERWYHLAGVFDGGVMTLFVDGVLQQTGATQTVKTVTLSASQPLLIGQDVGLDCAGVANSLAELRLWRTARSAGDINGAMKSRIAETGSAFGDLAGYWSFEDATWSENTGQWCRGEPTGSVKQVFTLLAPVTLASVLAVSSVMDLLDATGLDVRALLDLYRNGMIFGADGPAALLDALARQDTDEAKVAQAAILEVKRVALTQFAIAQIDAVTRPLGFPVADENDLSDYLLLDVGMGVQTFTSRLVQGTLGLQQYLQRCRLGLESSVASLNLSETQWDWIKSYRTWEANRKVFLHPETYLRPELRKGKTTAFRNLESALAQADLSKEGVERLYKRYLDDLSMLASVQTVGSWYEPSGRIGASLVLTPGFAYGGLGATAPAAMPLDTVSVEAWIRLGAHDISTPSQFLLGLGQTFSVTLSPSGDPTAQLNVGVGGAGTHDAAGATLSHPTVLQPDRWYHIAMVFDTSASQMHLYVDGVVATGTTHGLSALTFNTVQIGASASSPAATTSSDSGICDLRIWKVARSEQDIMANSRRRIRMQEAQFADLAAYWTFNDGVAPIGAGGVWPWTDATGAWTNAATVKGVSLEPGEPPVEPTSQAATAVDCYHFIGRARTAPHKFYHRIREVYPSEALGERAVRWGAWEEISPAIQADYATPVMADGKLYVFWAELRSVPSNSTATPPLIAHHEVTLKYSRRDADGNWLAAQSPFPVISVPAEVGLDASPAWRKPYAAAVTMKDGETGIVVIFGGRSSCTKRFTFVLLKDQTVIGDLTTSVMTELGAPSVATYRKIAVSKDAAPRLVAQNGVSYMAASHYEANGAIVYYDCHKFYFAGLDGQGVISVGFPGPLPEPQGLAKYNGSYYASSCVDGNADVILSRTGDPFLPGSQWAQVNANIAKDVPFGVNYKRPAGLAAWQGLLYCGFIGDAPIGWPADTTGALYILEADQAILDAQKPWRISFITPMPNNLSTLVSFSIGPDGTLYCVAQQETCLLISREVGGDWMIGPLGFLSTSNNGLMAPGLTAPGMILAPGLTAPVMARGLWYTTGYDSFPGPCWLASAQTLAGPWAIQEGGVSTFYRTSTLAVAEGLIYSDGQTVLLFPNPLDTSTSTKVLNSGAPLGFGLLYDDMPPMTPDAPLLNAVPVGTMAAPIGNQLGAYIFATKDVEFLIESDDANGVRADIQTRISQASNGSLAFSVIATPDFVNDRLHFDRMTTTALKALERALATDGVDAMMSPALQQSPEYDLGQLGPVGNIDWSDQGDQVISCDLSRAFGLYYRELFLFVPWLIAKALQKQGKFQEAQRQLEYVFKPGATDGVGYWRNVWLGGVMPENTLQDLESINPLALALYHQDPFDAAAIANLRPSAYQRAIVTAYIQNLIAWGDSLFATNTRETINQAEQLYRYAADLLGPPPRLAQYAPPSAETYNQLRSQAENEFLLQLQQGPASRLSEGVDPNLSVAHFSFYFGVPDNPEFLANWDLVEDRLFKIRNGLDLSGAPDDLSLFEPPLSLDDIIALGGSGAGGSTSQTIGVDAAASIPDLLYWARLLTGSVTEFGSSLLRALEMRDAESLAALQVGQQAIIADKTSQIRAQDINNCNALLSSLQTSLQGAQYRRDYYDTLLSDALSGDEKLALDLTRGAIGVRGDSALANLASIPFWALPTIFGLADGGAQPGAALQAGAAALGDGSGILTDLAGIASTQASYERRAQDWVHQKKLADFDITQAQRQISATQAQLKAAQLQYNLEQVSRSQILAVGDYGRNKFTNVDLYDWMATTLGELYQQLYQVALTTARMTEALLTSATSIDQRFISPDGWNGARRGLLAGEMLTLDLARMELAYRQWQNAVATETHVRTVSLKSLDPSAYLSLVRQGVCHFELSEALFDRDHPGHHLRRLESISVELAGVGEARNRTTGALTRLSHSLVRKPDADAVRFLMTGEGAAPGTALRRSLQRRRVGLSHSRLVDGQVQSEFHSGALNGFAGGGAVSSWMLELPKNAQRFDLSLVEDVRFIVRYTARYGGDAFKRAVEALLPADRVSLLVKASDNLSDQWRSALEDLSSDDAATMTVDAAAVWPSGDPQGRYRLRSLFIEGVVDGGATASGLDLWVRWPGASDFQPVASGGGALRGRALPPKGAAIVGGTSLDLKLVPTFGARGDMPNDLFVLLTFEEAGDGEA